MSRLKSVCVFAAASDAVDRGYHDAAAVLGGLLAERGLTLVYGGGQVGLMGTVARAVHARGGRVVAVIPHYLKTAELLYAAADEIIVTDGLRERKAVMEERADAFVTLPGGFGTLEETLEAITLKQLRRHNKPVLLLNTNDFFAPLLQLFDQCLAQRFVSPANSALYRVVATPQEVLDALTEAHRV